MTTEIFGTDLRYVLTYDGEELFVTFKGDSARGVIDAWEKLKPSFTLQTESILRRLPVERVRFGGSRFGNGIFNLCRYELRDLLAEKVCKDYRTEEDTMKMFYLENAVLCASRYSEACDDGLTIEIDAPLDTEFRFEREDGAVYSATPKDGVVKVPADFLADGRYLMYAEPSNGLPSNVLELNVQTGRKGKYASCRIGEQDLSDAVYRLATALYNTQKKVSAHIDGYDVI